MMNALGHPVKEKWKFVAQSRLTLCDPMDCSQPDFSVYGILQGRILEWVATEFSRATQGKFQTLKLLFFQTVSPFSSFPLPGLSNFLPQWCCIPATSPHLHQPLACQHLSLGLSPDLCFTLAPFSTHFHKTTRIFSEQTMSVSNLKSFIDFASSPCQHLKWFIVLFFNFNHSKDVYWYLSVLILWVP